MGLCVSGVSPKAIIAPDTVIHPSATIMARASVGSGTVVEAGAILHPAVRVGENCYVGSNAVLSHSVIGDHVKIGAGSVIGEAGFGLEMTDDGAVKIPHIGLVSIANSVSIGSSCTIDRGSLDNTIIGEHVMIDNLCHIAAQCQRLDHDQSFLANAVFPAAQQLGQGLRWAGRWGLLRMFSLEMAQY